MNMRVKAPCLFQGGMKPLSSKANKAEAREERSIGT